ncbi:MAG: HEAT repeat domain-containing protein, partial [Phycisphaerae bacterium]
MIRIALSLLLASLASPVFAYVDLATTLSRIVAEGQTVTVVEVEKFNREKGAVILRKVRDLKGASAEGPVRQIVGRVAPGGGDALVPRVVLEWAEPGRRALLFSNSSIALVCVGRGWYQLQSSPDGWWRLGPDRPDLPLAYFGSLSRLESAVTAMLAGKSAVITTLPHGSENEGASFELALNRTALPGLVRVQRLRADLRMPGVVMAVANNPAYYVGAGPAGEEEMPALIARLRTGDAIAKAEAAEDLRALAAAWAGESERAPKFKPAVAPLEQMMSDGTPAVRAAAASALLRITALPGDLFPAQSGGLVLIPGAVVCKFPKDEVAFRATDRLTTDLGAPDVVTRRHTARAAGLAGGSAAVVVPKLAELLTDKDEITRVLALEAIATLGPVAAPAMEAVTKLLDQPATMIDAADALGRIGPAAAPANPKLAKMLASDQPAVRWAAIRAMSQIGGPDAAPAVDAIVKVLKSNPSEVDGYNSMIYLGLLGPVARPAIPTIESTRIKNPVLGQYAIWAIEPETRFPWAGGGRGFGGGGGFMRDAEFARWIGESFVLETGDRFKPAAAILAKKVLDGSAGELPWVGYRVMSRFPDATLAQLGPALASENLQTRERATVALGNMGKGAAGAREQLEAAR